MLGRSGGVVAALVGSRLAGRWHDVQRLLSIGAFYTLSVSTNIIW